MISVGISRLLVLGVLMIALAAWLVTLPGVLAALAGSVPMVVYAPRFRLLRIPVLLGLLGTLAGALTWEPRVGRPL